MRVVRTILGCLVVVGSALPSIVVDRDEEEVEETGRPRSPEIFSVAVDREREREREREKETDDSVSSFGSRCLSFSLLINHVMEREVVRERETMVAGESRFVPSVLSESREILTQGMFGFSDVLMNQDG